MLNRIVIPSNEKICKEKNAPKKTAKYGQKWTKTAKKTTQCFNYTSFRFDSDGKFYAEFNDANPRAVKMFCKKLYPKKALQKNPKWPKIRKKTLLYL